MAKPLTTLALCVATLSIPIAYIFPAVQRFVTVAGVFRTPATIRPSNTDDLVLIHGTIHCEDIHYHAPSGQLYTACEDSLETRFSWFPPLALFNASVISQSRGGLFIINPKTRKSRKLKLENFSGPFVTHGIDVISDTSRLAGQAVYIFAVNHLPNPDVYSWADGFSARPLPDGSKIPKARSQIEIFHHVVGSPSAQHIRSVWHPQMTTPNDILALSPTEFLFTNDHHYREGRMRELEDLYAGASWTNTLHVELSGPSSAEASSGVKVGVAIDSIRNNNGLGHGRTDGEVLITSAAGGSLHLGELSTEQTGKALKIHDFLLLDSGIDNPSYFADPFASSFYDASGFVLAGLSRYIDLPRSVGNPAGKDPMVVWYARKTGEMWEKRVLFEDDSSTMRSASAAVLVALDPAKENGKRRAWLYATGFVSSNIVAAKVNL